jgi:hypothetical protein
VGSPVGSHEFGLQAVITRLFDHGRDRGQHKSLKNNVLGLLSF